MPTSSLPRRSPTTTLVLRVGVAMVLGGVLWSLIWAASAHYADAAFDRWLVAEARSGRQWTCPNRAIEGFPVALKLRCDKPTFRGEVAGHTAVGTLEELRAGMQLDRPGALVVALRGPLNLRAEDDAFQAELSWAELGFVVPGVLGEPAAGSMAATRLAVSLSSADQGDFNLRAAQVNATVGAAPSGPSDRSFTLTAQGVGLPTLDAVAGLETPADLGGQGVLTDATLLGAPTMHQLEAWRVAGGGLRLEDLSITKGTFVGTAQGLLKLDEDHRPAGRLDTVMTGFGPIAQRLGIPAAGVQLGELLSTLLTGGKTAPPSTGSVQLPLVLADGRLSVGPFPTAIHLAPLY